MAQNETYFYGQGKVKLAIIKPDGSLEPWRWIGDVSSLSFGMEEETIAHRESYSGNKTKVREWHHSPEMKLEATLHSLDVDNLTLFTQGTATSAIAGSVTGEALPNNLVEGSVVTLAHPGVSSLVITDSAGSPVTLDPKHYALEAGYGNVEILSLPSPPPTQPFKAAYQYAATKQVTFLSAAARPNVAVRYEGINLAEGNAPVIAEFYKASSSLLSQLALITSGDDVAGMEVNFGVLLDGAKPAGGALGQFGRIIQVAQ